MGPNPGKWTDCFAVEMRQPKLCTWAKNWIVSIEIYVLNFMFRPTTMDSSEKPTSDSTPSENAAKTWTWRTGTNSGRAVISNHLKVVTSNLNCNPHFLIFGCK